MNLVGGEIVAARYAACNRSQAQGRLRRANGCLYSDQRLGGPHSRGERWRMLLPAACRPGTFVGLNGTDCCSADVRLAASLHPECTLYFLRRSG